MKSELLSTFLEKKTDMAFTCFRYFPENLPAYENGSLAPQLILLDCATIDAAQLPVTLDYYHFGRNKPVFMALWGLKEETNIEKMAMNLGIHGLFYENDSPDVMHLGIKSIIKGQPWYPTHPQKLRGANSSEDPKPVLTNREKEILSLILLENSAIQMSQKLGISVYTINTHIANLYRKIHVSNRLQAALWAKKHLKHEEE